jgi:hypothetical protein
MKIGRRLVLLAIILGGCGQGSGSKPIDSASQIAEPVVPVDVSWQKSILCQPRLQWGDGSTTHQGTGFFVRTPTGRIAAVSSAHFLDFDGAPLLSAAWLNLGTGDAVASFTTGWGAPKPNAYTEDIRDDFWIMPVAAADASKIEQDYEVLHFETRAQPDVGELVWFPDKDDEAELGYRRVAGHVAIAETGQIIVELDGDHGVTLRSQSGSPVVSQSSGRVIGTVYGGGRVGNSMMLRLAPVTRMRIRIEDETNFPELKTVVGKSR